MTNKEPIEQYIEELGSGKRDIFQQIVNVIPQGTISATPVKSLTLAVELLEPRVTAEEKVNKTEKEQVKAEKEQVRVNKTDLSSIEQLEKRIKAPSDIKKGTVAALTKYFGLLQTPSTNKGQQTGKNVDQKNITKPKPPGK